MPLLQDAGECWVLLLRFATMSLEPSSFYCTNAVPSVCPADALAYLTTRLQSDFKVEVGAPQAQRKALAALVKPLKQ
jgi:hypothetical protein